MTESLLDKAPVGIFGFTDDGTLVLVNNTLCDLLQKNSEDLTGVPVENIFTLPTKIFFQTHFYPLVKMHGHAEEIFITLLIKDGGHLPVLMNAERMKWKGSEITCCACIVVRNRKKFEDELVAARKTAEKALAENTGLIQARAELQEHAEKLEEQMQKVRRQNHELQQFSHAVTHNLKEPLRKILLYSGKIQLEAPSKDLDKLLKANEQMKKVVSGLQEYIWLNEKSNQFVPVNLDAIIHKVVGKIIVENTPAILEWHSEHLGSIEGDQDQLELLFYHLITNAVKFRKNEKAKVKISSTVIKQNKFRSVENRYQYEDFLRIEITDEGMGYDPAYNEQVFELFRKFHYAEGQGLGLALCKKIVENHSGVISAQSVINHNTVIKVSLPVHQRTQ